MERWTIPREEFFELLLVKVDDQIFDGDEFSTLTVALPHHLLVPEEDPGPQRSRHLVFYLFLKEENLRKRIEERNYK